MVVLVETKIPKKMTTQVLLGILDDSITNTVKPLFENTVLYSRILLQMLFNYSTDSRRRFGNKPFYECAGSILEAIEHRNFYILKEAQIDRSRLMWAAKECLQAMSPILEIEVKVAKRLKGYNLKRYRLSLTMGCNMNYMFGMYQWCNSYSKIYDRLLQQIYLKYQKLLMGRANFTMRTSKMHVDKDQLESNLKMAVGRSIDRCDVEKGTLTSMIERTITTYTNNPEFSHLTGIAFSVSSNVRRRKALAGEVVQNFSSQIEDSDLDKEVYLPNFDGIDKHLAMGIKKLRGTALCHLVLNLPIILSTEEKQMLLGKT